MRARLTQMMAGATSSLEIGHVVDGDFAVRLVQAGYAVPIKEEPKVEVADAPKAKVETRKRKAPKKAD